MYKKEYYKEWRRKKILKDPTYRKRECQKYYEKHKEQEKLRKLNWKIKYPEKIKASSKKYIRRIRYQILSHYSDSEQPYCKICGFNDIRALQLDHLNNNGAEEKRKFGSNISIAKHLIENNYPKGYQVLCANCNTIKEIERRK